MSSNVNPFASLLCNTDPDEPDKRLSSSQAANVSQQQPTTAQRNLSSAIEQAFLITLDNEFEEAKARANICVYVGDSDDLGQKYIDFENLDICLIKRLQLNRTELDSLLRFNKESLDKIKKSEACEEREYFYLFSCFKRLLHFKQSLSEYDFDSLTDICFNLSRTIYELDFTENDRWFTQFIDLVFQAYENNGNLSTFRSG
jgi:hypothetical protein